MKNFTKLCDEDFNKIINLFKMIFENRNNDIKTLFDSLNVYGVKSSKDILKNFVRLYSFNTDIVSNIYTILNHMVNKELNISNEVNDIYFDYIDTLDFENLFKTSLGELDLIFSDGFVKDKTNKFIVNDDYSNQIKILETNMNILLAKSYAIDFISSNLTLKDYSTDNNMSTAKFKKFIDKYLINDLDSYFDFLIYLNNLNPVNDEERVKLLDELCVEYDEKKEKLELYKEKILNGVDDNFEYSKLVKKLNVQIGRLEKYINILSLSKFYSYFDLYKYEFKDYKIIYDINCILKAKNSMIGVSKNNLNLVYKKFDDRMFIKKEGN